MINLECIRASQIQHKIRFVKKYLKQVFKLVQEFRSASLQVTDSAY